MKKTLLFLLCIASICFAQLMPAKKADSVVVNPNALKYNQTVSPEARQQPRKAGSGDAMNDATEGMKGVTVSNDSLSGTLIGIGADFVGQMVKDRISPDSYETQSVNQERERR